MSKRDSNTDPFNAGEPTLPWQDPDSEAYDVADEPHEESRRDAGEAKGPWDADESGTTSRGESGSERTKGRARKRSTAAQEREASRRDRVQQARGTSAGRTAGRIFKVFLGIWLLSLLLSIGGGIVSCVAGAFAPSTPEDPYDVPAYDIPAFEEDENSPEAQSLELASTRLEHLMLPGSPEHDAEAGRIAAAFAQRVETDFGRTPDELGIDPSIVAEWVISSLVYEESSTNAFPEAEDPHASVYFDIESCSMMTMYFEFQSNLYDYLRDQELYLLDIKQGKELDDAQKTDIAGILQAAMVETGSRESTMCVRLTLQDGTWRVDEDDFERYCDYAFGMPA